MNKDKLLDLLQLLSALESWGFSNGQRMPDFLLEQINDSVEVLRNEVLK